MAKAKSTENLHDTSLKHEEASPKSSSDHIPKNIAGVLSGLGTLQQQHAQLVSAFNALLHLDSVTNPTRAMSPNHVRYPSRAGTVRRALSTGTTSDESMQWFDADDGPEEYMIEEPEAEMEAEEEPLSLPSDQETDSGIDEKEHGTPEPVTEAEKAAPVRRRTRLPAPAMADEMSLLNVLRKNVGKVQQILALMHQIAYHSKRIYLKYLYRSGSMNPYQSFNASLKI